MKKILFVQTNYPGFLNSFNSKLKKNISYKKMKEIWDKEWFGQSYFYSKNIKRYGFIGEEVIVNSWPLQSRWAKENKFTVKKQNLLLLEKLPESIKNYLGLRDWIKQILFQQIKVIKPDVVYMHDLSLLSTEDIKFVKKYARLVVGQIACPLPLNTKPLHSYDLIVSSFPHYVKMFRSWGVKSEYLPWCFEPSINKLVKNDTKKYDVCFIGGYSAAHSQGNKIMEQVASKVKVDFWGYGLSGLSPNSKIRRTYHGEIWGKDMYDVMAQSKIVLNRHINVAGNVANNMRMFDATGVGSLLITDKKPNMNEFFEVGKEVITYKNPRELVKLISYYLDHPTEAEKISSSGQRRTLKDHTYDKRMKDLAAILKKYL